MEQPTSTAPTSDDKLWAALAYALSPLISLIILLFLPDRKARPFIKAHNIQALIAGVAIYIITSILAAIIAAVTLGIGAICSPIIVLAGWGVLLYWAYQAYQGKYITIPVITNLVKNQGWG